MPYFQVCLVTAKLSVSASVNLDAKTIGIGLYLTIGKKYYRSGTTFDICNPQSMILKSSTKRKEKCQKIGRWQMLHQYSKRAHNNLQKIIDQ